ncbi:hypothetical protein [Flavisphingomonas formosensis]|uniref:hypothetical protein n=1 Tax=Flavisphingomonas formosensis TaxID=861534 RepID=UPI0012F997D6|nr:hypothetical protein [Sphingomonas formosensis]
MARNGGALSQLRNASAEPRAPAHDLQPFAELLSLPQPGLGQPASDGDARPTVKDRIEAILDTGDTGGQATGWAEQIQDMLQARKDLIASDGGADGGHLPLFHLAAWAEPLHGGFLF